eukprot:6181856-Pleurochrysis_carterae.AAC.1
MIDSLTKEKVWPRTQRAVSSASIIRVAGRRTACVHSAKARARAAPRAILPLGMDVGSGCRRVMESVDRGRFT